MPVFSISVVSRLTRLTARQVRYYEKVGLVKPARTRGNHRLFSRQDVDRLIFIRDLLNQGMSLEGIRASLDGVRTGGR